MLLIGFQLGNTGVMLAAIRDVAPRARLGAVMGVFGASSAVGMATGPFLAGILIDGFGWQIAAVFGLSAVLSVGTAALVTFGSREVRPEVVPEGGVIHLAFGAVRGVLGDAAVRRIFIIFGISFLANQMSRPYLPVRVEDIVGTGPGLASAIALVMGTAALVGGLIGPIGGALGDRVGFRTVLAAALAGGGSALVLMPFVPALSGLAILSVATAAATATISAMVFGLVATEVGPERRSATLNLVYLPLYAAGIIGPTLGAIFAAGFGLAGPFVVGGTLFLVSSAVIGLRRASRRSSEATAAT
jgi:MFS family permease